LNNRHALLLSCLAAPAALVFGLAMASASVLLKSLGLPWPSAATLSSQGAIGAKAAGAASPRLARMNQNG